MRGWIITIFLIIGLPGFFAGLVFVPMMMRAYRTNQVLSAGVAAEAQIVSVTDTGNIINNVPVFRIALNVRPPNGPPFTADVQRTISGTDIFAFQPGRTLPVKFNPADHSQVAIVYGN